MRFGIIGSGWDRVCDPVSQLADQRAVHDAQRRKSLEELRRLSRGLLKSDYDGCHHDILELPRYCDADSHS
jgi:hypothetical protein